MNAIVEFPRSAVPVEEHEQTLAALSISLDRLGSVEREAQHLRNEFNNVFALASRQEARLAALRRSLRALAAKKVVHVEQPESVATKLGWLLTGGLGGMLLGWLL